MRDCCPYWFIRAIVVPIGRPTRYRMNTFSNLHSRFNKDCLPLLKELTLIFKNRVSYETVSNLT